MPHLVRKPLLSCPSDYDDPLPRVRRFLRKAAAPPRALISKQNVKEKVVTEPEYDAIMAEFRATMPSDMVDPSSVGRIRRDGRRGSAQQR